MLVLVLGLILFIGIHSVRMLADNWRTQFIAKHGAKRWKGIHSLFAIVGFVLIVWGFGLAREHPVLLYAPPVWLAHLNALFTLIAFIFFFAARVPNNHIKAKFGHPQTLAVKIWSFGHLLAIGIAARRSAIPALSGLVHRTLCRIASTRPARRQGLSPWNGQGRCAGRGDWAGGLGLVRLLAAHPADWCESHDLNGVPAVIFACRAA